MRDARRIARRYRRWAGAALVGLSVLFAVNAVAPAPPPMVTVALAADDLPAGTVLATADVEEKPLPAGSVTSTPIDPALLLGRVLASPLAAGEQLTASRLLGDELLTGTPPGTVALPVRVADPGAAALVSAGDRIDLLATVRTDDGQTVSQVGTDLVVLLAGSAGPAGNPGGIDPFSGEDVGGDSLGGLLVVAASPTQARTIVGGAARSPLWLMMRGPR